MQKKCWTKHKYCAKITYIKIDINSVLEILKHKISIRSACCNDKTFKSHREKGGFL